MTGSTHTCPLDRRCPFGKVAVIGAGAVGATYAYTLMRSGSVQELVLVDSNMEKALGETEDLEHGTPYGHQVTVRAGTIDDARDAGLVVITAGVAQKPGETRLGLVRRNADIFRSFVPRLAEVAPEAVMLVVTNPVDVMARVAQLLSGLPAARVIGSGTVLDSARLRRLVADHCEVDARNVHAHVIGEHGDSEVVVWSALNVGTIPLDDFCRHTGRLVTSDVREETARRTREAAYSIIQRKGATQFAVAVSLERITDAILKDENSVLTVSTQLEGLYGIHGVYLSVPCVVGREGVVRQIELPLNNDELAALRRSASVLEETFDSLALPTASDN